MTQKKLCHTLRHVLDKGQEMILPPHQSEKSLANKFASFFHNKIKRICDMFTASSTAVIPPMCTPLNLPRFNEVLENEVLKIIILLHIKNEIQLLLSRGKPTALVLLDLLAAFDTIDNTTLLNCLKSWFGVCGTTLKWFTSYLSHCFQAIKIGSIPLLNCMSCCLESHKAQSLVLCCSYTPLR